MKRITLLALTALVVSNSRAQLAVTPVAGFNVSNYRLTSDAFPFEQNKPQVGYCAGILADIPLTDQLSLQPGVLYKLNGFRWETEQVKQTISINTLEIPVKLIYSFDIGKGNRLFIGAGPYAGINVSGKNHLKGSLTFDSSNYLSTPRPVDRTSELNFGGPHDIQRFDIGAGISVGVKTRNGLFVSMQGQYGIKDLAPSGSLVHVHNYNFGIVGGYSFRLKKHKAPAELPGKAE
jgi:hypothetical protein